MRPRKHQGGAVEAKSRTGRPCARPRMPRIFAPNNSRQQERSAMTPCVNFARLFAACLAGLTLGGIGSASALDYPTRPVRWIVS
jgi:hypothetical protein